MNKDTKSLLCACGAGAQMALGAMDGVVGRVKDPKLRHLLTQSIARHESLGAKAEGLLEQEGAPPAQPGAMAKSMSWIKTNWVMMKHPGDAGAAELVTQGCDMGVRTLARTRNQSLGATNEAKELAGQLMQHERELSAQLSEFL